MTCQDLAGFGLTVVWLATCRLSTFRCPGLEARLLAVALRRPCGNNSGQHLLRPCLASRPTAPSCVRRLQPSWSRLRSLKEPYNLLLIYPISYLLQDGGTTKGSCISCPGRGQIFAGSAHRDGSATSESLARLGCFQKSGEPNTDTIIL